MEQSLLDNGSAWSWAIPSVFRALESPAFAPELPVPPTARTDFAQALGYWAALHYLLIYRLGWSSPRKGLRWWYDASKPEDGDALSLVKKVWDADGYLDRYVAWLTLNPHRFLVERPGGGFSSDEVAPEAWQLWSRRVWDRSDPPAVHFAGGSNPLHLGDFSAGKIHSSGEMLIVDPAYDAQLSSETTCADGGGTFAARATHCLMRRGLRGTWTCMSDRWGFWARIDGLTERDFGSPVGTGSTRQVTSQLLVTAGDQFQGSPVGRVRHSFDSPVV